MDNHIKPRIAFCFSGQSRTLDQTYLFFKRNLFDSAKEQGFDYDVFCTVEDDEDVNKVNLLNPTNIEKIKSSEVEKIIKEKYGNFIDNEMYKYGYFTHTGIYSLLQQIYKVQRNILMVKNNHYDLILRLRFDTIFLNKLNYNSICEKTKKGGIICNIAHVSGMMGNIAHKFLFSYHEISDLYFMGGNDMRKFENIFDSFQYVVSDYKTHKVLRSAYKLISKMNTFIDTTNKKYKRTIIPTTLVNCLARIFGLQIFVGDSYYYKFLHGTKLHKIDICMILLRKKVEESLIRLRKKSCFEI